MYQKQFIYGHLVPIYLLLWGLCLRDYVERLCPKAQNSLKKAHESISGEILPQFDLNNLFVASKLGKLEKRHKNTLKKAHGPPKGPPLEWAG